MAKLKSEVRYQTQHKRPLGVAWLYRHYAQLLPLLRWWHLPIQWLNKGVMVWNQHREAQGKVWLTRPFPHLASPLTSVKSWWKQQTKQASTANQIASPVLVLVDPFSQHQHPERVEAVLSVLQKFGAKVQPLWMTQSPRLLSLWQEIHAFLQTNPTGKIVGIEPSELLVWRDEALDLLAKDSELKQHQSAFQLFEEWLADWADAHPDYVWQKLDRPVVVHWHCHQKSLSNVQKAEQVLRLIAPEVQVVSGGCCGMSGSFGYEQTELSRQIAQAHFIPSLQKAQTQSAYIITNGTSCTQQAKDLVQVDTVHIAELVRRVVSR
jgi:Fe-S oxidoreductase